MVYRRTYFKKVNDEDEFTNYWNANYVNDAWHSLYNKKIYLLCYYTTLK